MEDKIRFLALGGLDEIGKDAYVIEINDDIFVLECGVKFADKTTPGIDFIIADLDYLRRNKHRVKAYFISHGHDDQFGALPYIINEVPAPIYASPVTILAIKEFCRNKKFQDLKMEFNVVQPSTTRMIAGREVLFFHVVHSTPYAYGVAIPTSLGYVVYSSDFLIEFNTTTSYKVDLNTMARIAERGTLLLLSESIFASRSGYTAPKHHLTPHLEVVQRDSDSRLFVASYFQNIYHIQELFNFVIANKKRIAFYDQETADFIKLLNTESELVLPMTTIVSLDDIARTKKSDLIIFIAGNGEHLFNKISDLASGKNKDPRVRLEKGDTFCLAAPSASNLERLASDTVDELFHTEAKIYYFGRSDISGMHASQEDLKMCLSLLKPKYYIPVKGEFRHLLANAQIAMDMDIGLNHRNIFILDNGMAVNFTHDNGAVLVRDYLKTENVLIDGLGIGDVESGVIKDRQKLSDDGVIVMAVGVNLKTRKIVAEPDIQMRGFIFVKEAEHVLKRIQNIFVSEIEAALKRGITDFHLVRDQIADLCARRVYRDTGRDPMILPIVEVLE